MAEAVLLSSLVVLFYVYAGYPAFIWLLARWRPDPVRSGPFEPRVAIVIVVHNETARIAAKLDSCLSLDYPKEKVRIVLASDGSEDGTNAIVASYVDRGVKLLAYPARRGKAACLNDAMRECGEEVVMLTDARQRLDPVALRRLVENFADPRVGAVSGELVLERDRGGGFGEGIDAYWRYEKFIRLQESRFRSSVGVTGAIYAIRRECFREIPPDTILDDVVIPMNVVMQGCRVIFDGRAQAYDVPSSDPRRERARKVRTIAGNYQLLTAHPRFLVPGRNPVFVQLVSHKFLRLVAPVFLAALFVTSAMLSTRTLTIAALFALQVVGYSLPLAGCVSAKVGQWRVTRVATAFVMLNWYAVLGALHFVRTRRPHLWEAR